MPAQLFYKKHSKTDPNYKMNSILARYNDDLNKDKSKIIQILNKILGFLLELKPYLLDNRTLKYFNYELKSSMEHLQDFFNNCRHNGAGSYFKNYALLSINGYVNRMNFAHIQENIATGKPQCKRFWIVNI